MKILDPFLNIQDRGIEGSSVYGSELTNLNSLEIGSGNRVLRGDESGFWLGAEKFVDAPFRVDMAGNVTASSLSATGYIAVGGAASDVNANATTISGGKITANSITASQIQAATITATEIASNAITAAKISAGAVTTTKLAAGAVTANEISAGAVTASKISVSTLSSISADIGTITAGTINASTVNVTNLNASNIVSGVYGVGGGSQPSYLEIARDNSSGGNAYLRWVGGSKMWSDTNNDIGINAIGGEIYFYCNSAQIFYLDDNAQAVLGQDNSTYDVGLFIWGNLNTGRGDARIRDGALYVNTTSTPSEMLWVGGSAGIEGNLKSDHHDPRSSTSYNLGGSSKRWDILYIVDIDKSGGFGVFDEGVTMQDGRVLPDTEALLEMKAHPTKKTYYGKPIYDLTTLPKEVLRIPTTDNEGNPVVKDKNGKYWSERKVQEVNDKGKKIFKKVKEEHEEGESVFAMISILIGAVKELTIRVKELEKANK